MQKRRKLNARERRELARRLYEAAVAAISLVLGSDDRFDLVSGVNLELRRLTRPGLESIMYVYTPDSLSFARTNRKGKTVTYTKGR